MAAPGIAWANPLRRSQCREPNPPGQRGAHLALARWQALAETARHPSPRVREQEAMNIQDKMLIEWDLSKLTTAYCRLADTQDFASFVKLFTADATLEVLGRTHKGHEAILNNFRTRPQMVTRHVCTNHWFEIASANAAEGVVYLTLYRVPGPYTEDSPAIPYDRPTLIGDYYDRYVREGGVWKFAHRRLKPRFSRVE
ncbi:MAG: nuclear transport factor 2 family protein [Alphaproteobacteria bacterium]|nr:nuclear transport factor 2 family protein [Alphaproteobacteria bacterium]